MSKSPLHIDEKYIKSKLTQSLNGKSVEVNCPLCKSKIKVTVSKYSQQTICPKCNKQISISFNIH